MQFLRIIMTLKVKHLKMTNFWKFKFYITVKYYIGKSFTYNLY